MIRTFVAIDPGLATFGYVKALVGTSSQDVIEHSLLDMVGNVSLRVIDVDVFTSELTAQKLGVEMADDRMRRTRELYRWLSPKLEHCDFIAAEAMSFPRGANPITMISLAWGVICAEVERRALPLVTAYPTRWRKQLVRSGKEDESHAAAVSLVRSFVPYGRQLKNDTQLHALDALGVLCWSLTTNMARTVLR